MCFPRFNGLHQGVVDEHVLLLSLDKAVPLTPEHQLDEKKPIMEMVWMSKSQTSLFSLAWLNKCLTTVLVISCLADIAWKSIFACQMDK